MLEQFLHGFRWSCRPETGPSIRHPVAFKTLPCGRDDVHARSMRARVCPNAWDMRTNGPVMAISADRQLFDC